MQDQNLTDAQRIEKAGIKYRHHAHRMQCGVKLLENYELETTRSLRTGINSAHVTDLAVGELLIAKGVITRAEYHEALAAAMEIEAERVQKEVQKFVPNAQLGSLYPEG